MTPESDWVIARLNRIKEVANNLRRELDRAGSGPGTTAIADFIKDEATAALSVLEKRQS